MKYFYSIFIFVVCTCCNNPQDKNKIDSAEVKFREGLQADPQLLKTDSLQVLYYDDPDGDSLRYTRFYTYTSLADTATVHALLSNLDQPYATLQGKKACRSEGKIYCYAKGEVVKTIYFSTRSKSCNYLYYIRNGEFLYFDMDEKLNALLQQHKQKAVEPTAADE